MEPLRALLDSYKDRLEPSQNLEERLREYPNTQIETKRLEFFQKMMEGMQDLLQK